MKQHFLESCLEVVAMLFVAAFVVLVLLVPAVAVWAYCACMRLCGRRE